MRADRYPYRYDDRYLGMPSHARRVLWRLAFIALALAAVAGYVIGGRLIP